jgi:hypothetical protein
MPHLTILNHCQMKVGIRINNADPVTLDPGGKLERDMDGPVNLRAVPTGANAGLFREGTTADGLVENRVLVVDVEPDDAYFTFTVV